VLRPNSERQRDIVTDYAIGMVAEQGRAALTVRGLAKRIRVAPPAIQQWVGPRARMLETIAATFGQGWMQWGWRRTIKDGPDALLPTTPEEVTWTRVWLALLELGRVEPEVGEVVAVFREQERALLAHVLPDIRDDADRLVLALALVDGLRVAVCQPPCSVDPERARDLLRRSLGCGPSAA